MTSLLVALLLAQQVKVTNTTPPAAIAARCVNAAGTAFESCAGAGGAGSSWFPDGGSIGSVIQGAGYDGGAWRVYVEGQAAGAGGLTDTELRATPVPTSSTGIGMSDWIPNPKNIATAGAGQPQYDVAGNLMVRAQILTDEGSFSDGFPGAAFTTAVSGTLSFTNGSTTVTGSGTAFTTEVGFAHYIKRTADGETTWARISSVTSDTELELTSGYTGTTGSGVTAHSSYWVTATPAGSSITVTGNQAVLTNSLTSGHLVQIHRSVDYASLAVTFDAEMTLRQASQDLLIGYVDDVTTPAAQAAFVFAGTDATKIICRTSSHTGDATDDEVTLPEAGTTTGHHAYEIFMAQDMTRFTVDGTAVHVRQHHLPDPYRPMKFVAQVKNNTAVVTSTVLSVDWVSLASVDRVDANVTNAVASRLQGQMEGRDRDADPARANPLMVGVFDGTSVRRMAGTTGGKAIITGDKTNNDITSDATNLGTLPAVASAAAPTYVAGRQVALSTDLSGAARVVGPLTDTQLRATAVPVSLGSTTITGTAAVTQSGTWTMQPGNTANTTPWLTTDTPRTVASANNTGTCTSITVSTTVLASNASRRAYGFKASEDNTAKVHCKLGATATTSNTIFGAGAGWSQDTGAVYTGVIDCIAASGTQSVCVYEVN